MIVLSCAAALPLQAQVNTEAGAAQPQSFDAMVRVDAGASCLDRERLIERVARWRQRAPVDPSIRVHVRGDSQLPTRVFFSVVRAGTQPTERVLDNAPADCDQLHSAVALSIALAIDAILAADRAAPMPAALPNLSPPPSAAKPAPRRHATGPSPYVELGLLGGVSVGVVTNLAVAGLPRLQFAPLPWLALAVAGIGTRSDSATIADVPGAFSTTVLAAGVDACVGGETVERLSFFMCGGARGGQFIAAGAGYSDDLRRTRRWWAIAGSGQARAWIVPSVAIGISIEALFALASRELTLIGKPTGTPNLVRTMPRVGLSVSAGPVFRFF
jgi:hypothetical protein